ncbi:hypothetical protein N7509_001762 [Penicillium cosmopolitanum]|uniref:AB hydrolase-1 domain-containing protein n=1 Tax=Penicillium cosmopolitanum TaxID=1131564 RepID=A0A9X0BCU4_9EURO|nr:uncharacterized protein N7509_001762 [Penicillium cosmopolitanum]KAJ5407879.1 hypothetical protein N7509_001762 [Penicillium cosmopolitanum]
MPDNSTVLPRPWTRTEYGSESPIQAPSEAAFVKQFGNVLPEAQFMPTMYGKAAYYSLSPSSSAPANIKKPISRVVFVHGVQTPAIGMQPLASALKSRFPYAHCVLVDLWGHGLSATPIIAHDADRFHQLIDGLMLTLRWDDAHFIGYSFGGSTVASYAALEPGSVASMVLVAPAGLLRSSELSEVERGYMRGGEGLEDRSREWVFEFLEGGQLVVPSDWKERVERGEIVAEAVRDWQMKNHKGHAASVVGIVRDGGVFDKHAEFATASKAGVKNFCVLGELDDLCSVQRLKEVGMENVAVVPQVGHGVVRERVLEVAGHIEEFWKKIEKA